jgi:hypothetical protein
VVAMSSPEPTMDAERMKPGPKNCNLPFQLSGGSLMEYLFMMLKVKQTSISIHEKDLAD